jgi:uncharacterized protein (DUF1800 family)
MRLPVSLLLGCVSLGGMVSVVRADCGPANTACLVGQRGDMDLDGDIDLEDAEVFLACLGGPGAELAPSCMGGDFDGDADIDLEDYRKLQARTTGACSCPLNCGINNEACRIGTPGDLDLDGDVDFADAGALTACLAGPGGGVLPGCASGDLDGDLAVDLRDYAALQRSATGSCGCPPNLTPPETLFEATAFLGEAPLTVTFDAARTTDREAVVADYDWDFGNGMQGSGQQIDETFTTPGNHTVTLTATDAGGLSSTRSLVVTVSDGSYNLTDPVTDNEARRFLWQAAFGPTLAETAAVTQNGYEAWIDAQAALPPTHMEHQYLLDYEAKGYGNYHPAFVWDDVCVEGADQLRQRMAWALMQIVVMNWEQNNYDPRANMYYYSTYMDHALGNYRDLLEFVTLSHHMGVYLTYMGNRKADPVSGSVPDENYARELIQLFSVGLWELNLDGTYKLDAFGAPIPVFGNSQIQQFARIFTGLDWNNDVPWQDAPLTEMGMREWHHEFGDKQLLDYPGAVPAGGYIPAITSGAQQTKAAALQDVQDAIDNVFYHPNCAPFVSRQLIQRLVTSNPTPAYVERVATAFEGGGPFGSGVRGDLLATVKAILLDDEARDPAFRVNPQYGLVREPLLVRWGLYRVLQRVDRPQEVFPFRIGASPWSTLADFGQAWMQSPSVFNFYPPDYIPPGTELAQGRFVAPELRIYNDVTAMAIADRIHNNLVVPGGTEQAGRYAAWLLLANNPPALVNVLNNEIMHGSLTPEAEAIMVNALQQINGDIDRIRTAVWMMTLSPEFRILK